MRRFPKCPLIPVFVDSEIVSENQSKDGSTLVTERRCVIDIDAPRLLKRVIVCQDYVREWELLWKCSVTLYEFIPFLFVRSPV